MILDITETCLKIEPEIATFIHNVITLIKIAVPIFLVIFGMLDFGKGVLASKEDEIKKGQHTFIKRLLAGAAVFFMITLSQFVIGIVDKKSDGEFWNCANKIMNGKLTKEEIEKYEQEKKQEKILEEETKCCNSVSGIMAGQICTFEHEHLLEDANNYEKCIEKNVKPLKEDN